MPITAAEFTNINEDQLKINYDTGKIWFVSVGQGSRFEQEMIDQPIIPTEFGLVVPIPSGNVSSTSTTSVTSDILCPFYPSKALLILFV